MSTVSMCSYHFNCGGNVTLRGTPSDGITKDNKWPCLHSALTVLVGDTPIFIFSVRMTNPGGMSTLKGNTDELGIS